MHVKKGFTLAEVLITLAVIGIVAAMTLPGLMHRTQYKILESQFKKSYAMLSQAIQSVIMQEYGGVVSFNYDNVSYLISSISSHYKQASNKWPKTDEFPNNSSLERCIFINSTYSPYNSNGKGTSLFNDGIIQVTDGSTIYFDTSSADQVAYGRIFVALDVNGWRNKPNKQGYDFFMFEITENGKLVPMGAKDSLYPEDSYCSTSSTSTENGFGCTIRAFSDPHYFSKL